MYPYSLQSISLPLLATAVISLITGCGGGSSNSSSDNGAPIALTGGYLATQYAESTAACTSATSGVISGNPSETPNIADTDDFAPSPPSIGADIPVTYFGPPPSSVNRNLIGPHQLLTAGTLNLDSNPATITLPLYKGRLSSDGPNNDASIWYIVTDTSDEGNSEGLGLNFSSKLNFANLPDENTATNFTSKSVRQGFYESENLVFKGGIVDFAADRVVKPGSSDTSGTNNLLSSLTASPGAIGSDVGDPDGFYSPLVQVSNAGNHIYNAPMVSFDTNAAQLAPYCDSISDAEETTARKILHDSVSSICPGENGEPGTVTIELAAGFSFGRPVFYISTDASNPVASALEGAVYAPAMANIPVGNDDSLFSAVERIFGFTNGPVNITDEVNPQRQGFNSALTGQGGPLNVLGGIPTVATDYSPLWDLNLGEWTKEAIDNGYRSRLTEEFSILGFVERGFITGPGGSDYGSSGIIINCPIVHRLL